MSMEENEFVEDLQSQEDEDSASSSSTITDVVEDDASSPNSPNSPSMDGPLNHLSEIITQLPIKRGLSKFYGGKSQSFTSLASVKSLEDLPKKENPYNMRMKMCRSYGGGLDGYQNQQQRFCSPKHTISKRMSSRGSFLSTMVVVGRKDLISTCNRPPISIQK